MSDTPRVNSRTLILIIRALILIIRTLILSLSVPLSDTRANVNRRQAMLRVARFAFMLALQPVRTGQPAAEAWV